MIAKDYWNRRYRNGTNSGDGSYGPELQHKLNLLSNLDIKSITEIGCGDFHLGHNLLKLYPNTSYIGLDISEVVIEKNRLNYPHLTFGLIQESREIPEADLVMCIDVLFHVLDDQEYDKLLTDIEDRWTKYLAITAYEDKQSTSPHLRIRKFDYKRFGKPIIREIVEKKGKKYFYLFKKPIDPKTVSCCLITKDEKYPPEILAQISQFGFGEILILTNCDSPHRKYELFNKAKYDYLYYQDDDAICSIKELFRLSKPDILNISMKPSHIEGYKNTKMTMGLGWGSIFPKYMLKSLKKYTDKWGEDEVYKRETERILTSLNYPQNRLSLPITDLPSATAPDRLWRQPNHHDFISIVEERCKELI